jgi:hypothetical protein
VEALQNVELSHVLRVFFFHAVKTFQDNRLASGISGCAIADRPGFSAVMTDSAWFSSSL